MLLVQSVDAMKVLPTKKKCSENPDSCVIGIVQTDESIPKIEVRIF
jgi:hypothetical protein